MLKYLLRDGKKQRETGRSMIEMLGVLVIIGLLSVGAVSGYRYAMNRYESGLIQEIIAQAKILVTSNRVQTQDLLIQFLNKTRLKGYDYAVDVPQEIDRYAVYEIKLKNVGNGVQQGVYMRKNSFARMDIMVAPSNSAVEEIDQSKESWENAGMSSGVFDVLEQSQKTTPLNGSDISFSFIKQLRMTGNNSGPDEPTVPDTPGNCPVGEYETSDGECSKCDPDSNLHWDTESQQCVECTAPKTEWSLGACRCPAGTYGESCTPCADPKEWRDDLCQCPVGMYGESCTPCASPKEWRDDLCQCPVGTYGESCAVCNSPKEWRDNSCQCPTDKPIESGDTCVECLTHSDCTSSKPQCESNVCTACSSGYDWNETSQSCVKISRQCGGTECYAEETSDGESQVCRSSAESNCIYSPDYNISIYLKDPKITEAEDATYQIEATCLATWVIEGQTPLTYSFGIMATGYSGTEEEYLQDSDLWNLFYDYCYQNTVNNSFFIPGNISLGLTGSDTTYTPGSTRCQETQNGYSDESFALMYICTVES